ncbi:unnamed protein product [Closterium sp. NIES-53]
MKSPAAANTRERRSNSRVEGFKWAIPDGRSDQPSFFRRNLPLPFPFSRLSVSSCAVLLAIALLILIGSLFLGLSAFRSREVTRVNTSDDDGASYGNEDYGGVAAGSPPAFSDGDGSFDGGSGGIDGASKSAFGKPSFGGKPSRWNGDQDLDSDIGGSSLGGSGIGGSGFGGASSWKSGKGIGRGGGARSGWGGNDDVDGAGAGLGGSNFPRRFAEGSDDDNGEDPLYPRDSRQVIDAIGALSGGKGGLKRGGMRGGDYEEEESEGLSAVGRGRSGRKGKKKRGKKKKRTKRRGKKGKRGSKTRGKRRDSLDNTEDDYDEDEDVRRGGRSKKGGSSSRRKGKGKGGGRWSGGVGHGEEEEEGDAESAWGGGRGGRLGGQSSQATRARGAWNEGGAFKSAFSRDLRYAIHGRVCPFVVCL